MQALKPEQSLCTEKHENQDRVLFLSGSRLERVSWGTQPQWLRLQ